MLTLLFAAAGCCGQPVRTTPAFDPGVASLSLPPSLEDRLIYYSSFDSVEPDLDDTAAQLIASPPVGDAGIRGSGASAVKDGGLQLRSEAFSPHQPLTVSFWWALGEDERIDGSFGLFHLTNGRGIISHFSRGKGEWCGLERPTGVLQVYYIDGIKDVNALYDGDLAAHYDLAKGAWHHTSIVISGASLVEVYTDGELAYKTRAKGRAFAAADRFHDLTIGSRWSIPIAFDEVMIHRRALSSSEIRTYVTAIRQMVDANYPQ